MFIYFKNFICLAGKVKNFEGPFLGGLPIVAPEISNILFTHFDFIFLLYLLIPKVSCVSLEWLKSLNFEGPN